jgi:hypothetical protein
VRDGPFKDPLPRSWAGDFFFFRLLPLSSSRSPDPSFNAAARFSAVPPTVGEPGEFGSGWLCLGRVLRCALTTHAIVIIQVEWFVEGGAGMQRALVVGMSLACLNTEEAFGFSAPGMSVRGGIMVNF